MQMKVIDNQPYGWRGTSAKHIRLAKPRRMRAGNRRLQFTEAVLATVEGKNYLFPLDRKGNVRKIPACLLTRK